MYRIFFIDFVCLGWISCAVSPVYRYWFVQSRKEKEKLMKMVSLVLDRKKEKSKPPRDILPQTLVSKP
jgi:hypothetical protein